MISEDKQRYYIIESLKGTESLRYSISAHNEEECRAIYEDYREQGEVFIRIEETISPFEWSRSKIKEN